MSGSAPTGGCAAIVLAGGRASRMGGIAKPMLLVGGRSLLAIALDAADATGCRPAIVAGPRPPDGDPFADRAAWVREEPPLGGPAAGIVAALATLPEPGPAWTLVLAADQPAAEAAARLLRDGLDALPAAVDGRCLAVDGRAQWLTGIYRTAALRRTAAALPRGGAGASVRALLAPLRLETVDAPAALAADVDTWEDLAKARGGTMTESRTLPPEALDAWSATLRERFGLAEDAVPIALVLDLARDVANGVARPAAPLSTFVAGLVAGQGGGGRAEIEEAVAAITELAAEWSSGEAP